MLTSSFIVFKLLLVNNGFIIKDEKTVTQVGEALS